MNYRQNYHRQHNNSKTMTIFTPDDALTMGTLFKDLYKPYKISAVAPIAIDEEERAMLEINKYAVCMIDMNLFLDVHPEVTDAIELYNEFKQKHEEMLKNYEKKFGPLNLGSKELNTTPWAWIQSNWPWMESA